jgi:hypothetical protein
MCSGIMKNILLRPLKATPKLFKSLEKKGLIGTMSPTPRTAYLPKGADGAVDTIYRTSPKYGTHKLMAVGKNAAEISLTDHPDNEDFIIIDITSTKYKPLYFVIALSKKKEFEKKAKAGKITSKDVLAIELAYNGPTSVFTLNKDVPHCEVTVPGKGKHPVFYVTEPSDFAMGYVNQYGLEFKIDA